MTIEEKLKILAKAILEIQESALSYSCYDGKYTQTEKKTLSGDTIADLRRVADGK